MDPVAALASGGLDSSVMVAELAREADVYPVYVRAGLAWESEELAALGRFLTAVGTTRVHELTVLSVPVAPLYPDVTGTGVPGATAPDEVMYIPGRNILLIGLTAVWCSTHGVSRIAIGSLGGNPFPDATPEFFDSFASALSRGLSHEISVEAPFRGLHKADLVRDHSDDLPLELTLTCARPAEGAHCGDCNKCYERQQAFATAGVADPTLYSASVSSGPRT